MTKSGKSGRISSSSKSYGKNCGPSISGTKITKPAGPTISFKQPWAARRRRMCEIAPELIALNCHTRPITFKSLEEIRYPIGRKAARSGRLIPFQPRPNFSIVQQLAKAETSVYGLLVGTRWQWNHPKFPDNNEKYREIRPILDIKCSPWSLHLLEALESSATSDAVLTQHEQGTSAQDQGILVRRTKFGYTHMRAESGKIF